MTWSRVCVFGCPIIAISDLRGRRRHTSKCPPHKGFITEYPSHWPEGKMGIRFFYGRCNLAVARTTQGERL